MVQLFDLLMVLSVIPIFAFLLDGYYQKSMMKGWQYIGVFLLTVVVSALLLRAFQLHFVVLLPLFIVALALIFRKKKA